MNTKVTWAQAGVTWTPKTTKQIVSFSLAGLGQNPTINRAMLTATSSRSNEDGFTANYNGKHIASFTVTQGADVTAAVTNALARGSIDLTTEYYGNFIGPGGITTFTSTVSYTLTVEVAGTVVTDTRSSGELSAASAALGQTVTMTITPIDDAHGQIYSHKVTWQIGTGKVEQTPGVGVTSTSITIDPNLWAQYIPSAAAGTMTVTLDTLNSGASVGTRTYSLTVTVPDTNDYRPTIGTLSQSAINTGALEGRSDYFAGASRSHLSLSGANPGAGASIVSITYSGWGESISTTAYEVDTGIIQNAGTVRLVATATDSRGRTAQTSYDITVNVYEPPHFEDNGIIAERWSTEQQAASQNGDVVRVNARFGCYVSEQFPNNTAHAYAAIRARGSSTWSAETELTNGVDAFINNLTLDKMTAYELYFRVEDDVMTGSNSVFAYVTLSSSQYLLHFSNNGHSVGIGQEAAALETGEIGRVDINPEWNVYIGGMKFSMQDVATLLAALSADVHRLQDAVDSLQS